MWKKLKAHPWWLLAGIVLLALAMWGAYSFWFAKAPQPPLITAAVERGDIEESVLATGTIQASKLVNVGAQVSGQVRRLYVKLGDPVSAGQLIAEVDATTQQNNLQDAQAALASAHAQKTAKRAALAQAQQTFDRQKYMYERDAASKADYQNAQQALASARADLAATDSAIKQADLRVKTARTNLGYARITAPMDGTIVAIVTEEGQTMNAVQSAPTVVKLAHLDPMTIQAQISEADVPRIRPGLSAYFTILGQPERQHNATLRNVEPGPSNMVTYDPNATSNSSTAVYYNGLLDAPNPQGTLRIGMTAQVSIVLDQAKNVLLIPSGALVKRPGGKRGGVASSASASAAAAGSASAASATGPAPAAAEGVSAPASAPPVPATTPGSRQTVRVVTGKPGEEVVQERSVRIGLNNRVNVVVLEGLKEGERVVVGDSNDPTNSRMGRRGSVRL